VQEAIKNYFNIKSKCIYFLILAEMASKNIVCERRSSLTKGVKTKRVTIPITDKEQTSAILSIPEGIAKGTAIIVAHGAGNDMENQLLAAFSDGLAAAGYPTLRFNFLYKERGRKAPDSPAVLEGTWLAAYRFITESSGLNVDSVVAAGKSMGGRIASQMVASGLLPVTRLIFLGYPLHPANNKEKLRDAHLYKIAVPMLFFAGTRDPLCDLNLLDTVLKRLRHQWELHTIEGGDHSFHVPKSSGLTDEAVFAAIIKKTVEWLSRTACDS
jgi:predicted alpha/beta-hydrolase family hydrolase